MAVYGTRDGEFRPRVLRLGQKRLNVDHYPYPVSSATYLEANIDATSTAAVEIGTAIDHPRAIKFINGLEGESERKVKMVVKGYNGQGNYVEEVLELSSAAAGQTDGSVAFAYIDSIIPATATKGFGTYSTVHLHPSDRFGLTEYCPEFDDIKDVHIWAGTSGARTIATSNVITTSNFSKPNQTLELKSQTGIPGSTLAIKYLSEFQRRDAY